MSTDGQSRARVRPTTRRVGKSRKDAGQVPLDSLVQRSESSTHSRAFDALVGSDEDVVGLLAYALFKQSVRESAIKGNRTDLRSRDLTQASVAAFRSSAERMITMVVTAAIEESTPSIQETAALNRMDSHHSDLMATIERERGVLVAHVDERTGFKAAFVTNLSAWVVTLIITVAVIFIAKNQSIDEVFLDQASPKSDKNILDKSTKGSVEKVAP